MLNKKLLKKWIKALRSGDYEQGEGSLCSDDGRRFCCLGVLADIQGFEWEVASDGLIPVYKNNRKMARSSSDYLPEKIAEGLDGPLQEELIGMNDGCASFNQIANFIEDRYLK